MPINIPEGLPAGGILENENIFVLEAGRASHQDIRPLKIAVMNLMPTKITTETQLIRLLSNSSLQVDLTLVATASHTPKHTPPEHMKSFYKSFDDIKDEKFDGLVITGAPVESLEFEDVDYWRELCSMMEWSKSHVFSSLYICWAAQAGLYYHFGIKKYPLEHKLFGIYSHYVLAPRHPMMRGFDEWFFAPHSRYTEVREADIIAHPSLELLSASEKAGAYIVASRDGRMFFVTGHPEYDAETLSKEYFRDVDKGLDIEMPDNYFPQNDPKNKPLNVWRSHANLLFNNWLNYFVYQRTPFDINELK